MRDLNDPSNRLRFSFKTVLAGVALMTLPIEFSEAVPNAQQQKLIAAFLDFGKSLVADAQAAGESAFLFDPAATAMVSYQVIAADGTVLLDEDGVTFDPSVPNEQQIFVLAKLAEFGVQVAESA